MIFSEKKITLKDGRAASIKTPDPSDAEKLLGCIKTACGETDFLMKYSEDWDKISVESEEMWIRSAREAESKLIISCYSDGKIVGTCNIDFNTGRKTCHRAAVGIAIIKEYWNLGIGTALFEELLGCAEMHEGCEIVELEYIEGNDRGRAHYDKFGFKEVAVRPYAFKLKDGSVASEYLMQKMIRK